MGNYYNAQKDDYSDQEDAQDFDEEEENGNISDASLEV